MRSSQAMLPGRQASGAPLPWICIVSTARSGTKHLCRLLGTLQGGHAGREIFSPIAPSYLDDAIFHAFSDTVGIRFTDYRDPRLGKWIHENIQAALDIVQGALPPGTRFASLKIFEDHLPFADFASHFAEANDVRFLILKRRPIDAFISLQKVLQFKSLQQGGPHLKSWFDVDTTTLRLPIDADAFASWHQSRSRWFVFVEGLVRRHGKRSSTLVYEEEIFSDDEKTLQRLIHHLSRLGVDTGLPTSVRLKRSVKRVIVPAARRVGITTPWDLRLGDKRQDRNTLASEKVTNWLSFMAALIDRHDPRMLDTYFVRSDASGNDYAGLPVAAAACEQPARRR